MLRILEHPTGIPRPISMILAYPALDFNFTSWMSPANLKVLRTEQSESHMPGIIKDKDHMTHKSPLSVVDDVEKTGKRQRQQSWGQAIGSKVAGLAMSPMREKGPDSTSHPTSPLMWTSALPRTMSTKITGWLAPDSTAESNPTEEPSEQDSEAEDDDETETVKGPDGRRDADKSLQERVKTPHEEKGRFSLAPMTDMPSDVNAPGVEARRNGLIKKKKAPIGTRLTMTSRVGYFQDKIISPSMVSQPRHCKGTFPDALQMRAMAILYIGPNRNPDFETDYYISPILSPSHLLAYFPPVYLICGERDPFVDDTIIFAGKIRDAKRHRRAEAEAQSCEARHGDALRMTSRTTDTPDRIMRETDEDWVSMRIIEGWGHGFLQMSSLMKEVNSVMVEMADWIDESFARAEAIDKDNIEIAAARAARVNGHTQSVDIAVVPPEEQIPPPNSTLVKPVKVYKDPETGRPMDASDLGAPVAPDINVNEEDGTITFTPKSAKRRKPPPSQFNPVPRRRSKDNLDMHRSNSAPRFDLDETGSSGEAVILQTPTLSTRGLPASVEIPRGSGAFAFFNGRQNGAAKGESKAPSSTSSALFQRRSSGNEGKSGSVKTNSLVAAAVAGARAASPALAAAGLVPEKVGDVSEVELMRRRRMEAVFGLGETDSAAGSDESDQDE